MTTLCGLIEEKMHEILKILSSERTYFYSEKDFQFCLGWALKETVDTKVFFERRYDSITISNGEKIQKQYIDILLESTDGFIPIELKYKTREAPVKDENREHTLLNQSAQDIGCYGFVKDISRIESLKYEPDFIRGFALILTNDPYYYSKGNKRDAAYKDFFIYGEDQPRTLKNELIWKGKEEEYPSITLRNSYYITRDGWRDYYSDYGFKYLLLEIK